MGSFNTGDAILAIYENGTYELTNFELTNHYKSREIKLIEKFNPEKIITAVHYDGNTKNHYVKRFIIETSTFGKRFGFISDERGSKLHLVTMDHAPTLSFNYRTKRGDKKSREEYLVEFVDVKGWKAMGNKLGSFLRMSGFKWIKNQESDISEEENENIDPDELTLFT